MQPYYPDFAIDAKQLAVGVVIAGRHKNRFACRIACEPIVDQKTGLI
ncbi:MAG TPA: hypothetical protein PKM56_07320 [Candidatus Rifleibacterium sp.]|nr:hypothetical protein [Candidatus Rifleibacterium sp.]